MTKMWAGRSKGMLFGWGMLVGLTFLFLVPRDAAGRLQMAYARVFRWPLALGSGVVRAQATTQVRTVSPKEHEAVLQAYQQLRHRSDNLEAQLQEATSQIEKLTKLRAKPGLEHMQTIPAKVITLVQDELTISQGQESGVAVGHYVLSLTDALLNDQCVIGVISGVSATGARVKLITDPTSRLPVSIGRLNASWVLEGRGDGAARIANVPDKYAIREHDVVYAQPKRGFLDVPFVAAEVAQCRRDPDRPIVQEITVRPMYDLAALSDVVVIKPASAP
jgi:cell shape-determining protein MreC